MSIGAGIFLVVVGAILAFALDGDIGGGFVSLDLIGYILMGAGALVAILGLGFTLKRGRSVSTTRSSVDPATGDRIDQRETKSDSPGI